MQLIHLLTCLFFQDRVDEFDYKKPLEGQAKIPIEKHWRKHTLACINPDSGEVSRNLSIVFIFIMSLIV